MRKFRFVVILTLLFVSCHSVKIQNSNYDSICWLQTKKSVTLKIDNNNSFQYFFAYSDEEIKGKWIIKKDTLILFSPKFLEKKEELSPIVKNTNLDSLDKYLIRGKKLYAINKEGVKKHCYLVRAKQ
jgi:hypothetical protein